MSWNDLSMADRAKYIKLSVNNGITSLNDIREVYNRYDKGGNLYDKGGPVYNADKKRWYNYKGEELAVGHGYWSDGAKKYVMYGTDGSVTKYDPIDWAKKKRDDIVRTRKRLEQQYAIPVDNRVAITQNNKGNNNKDRGALVSQNQVDSILKYANKTEVPKYEALGLYAQESILSNADSRGPGMFYGKKLPGGKWQPEYIESKKNMISPVLMGSAWSYINDNPYNDYITTLEKIKNPEERKAKALAGRRYLEKQAKKFDINISPLEYSLKLYKSGKYNTGDKNHTLDVRTRGNNLKGSPEITEMINNSPFK